MCCALWIDLLRNLLNCFRRMDIDLDVVDEDGSGVSSEDVVATFVWMDLRL
jgi:hypothetical protein